MTNPQAQPGGVAPGSPRDGAESYLARYRLEGLSLRQGLLRLPWLVLEEPAGHTPWHDRWSEAWRGLLGAADLSFAYRLSLRGRRLERAVLITGAEEAEAGVRSALRAFLRLNETLGQSAETCATREAHDNVAGTLAAVVARVDHGAYATARGEVMHDFRLLPLIDDLLVQAVARGWTIDYQLTVRRTRPTPAMLRLARKNVAAMAIDRAMPDELLRHQQALVARLARAEFQIDEFLAHDPGAAGRVVVDAVRELFLTRLGTLGFAEPPLVVTEGDSARSLMESGLPGSYLEATTPFAAIAGAVTAGELQAWLLKPPVARWSGMGLANSKLLPRPPAASGTTIVNHGKLEFIDQQTIQNMSTTNISVTLGNGVTIHGDFIVANRIKDSFTRAAEASIQDELKKQLAELVTLVGQAVEKMPPTIAAQASQDLQTIVGEATSPQPRKAWYKLSAEGLLEAAKTVGEMATPIVSAVRSILAILG